MIELAWFAAGLAIGGIILALAHVPKSRGTTTYTYRGQHISSGDYREISARQADMYARRLAKHLEHRQGGGAA